MRKFRPDARDWAGACALVLALSLGLGWCISIVLASTPWTETVSDAGANLLNGIGQVMAGAVATYLGSQIGRPDRPTDKPTDDE